MKIIEDDSYIIWFFQIFEKTPYFFNSLGAKEIIFYEWKSIFQIIEEQKNFNFDAKEFDITKNCAFNILSQQVFG